MKKYEQFIAVRPKSKERPRFSKKGFAYTSAITREYENKIAFEYKGPLIDATHTIAVELNFDVSGTFITVTGTKKPDWKCSLKGDIDNYAKSILDALNGVAWEDDKQIVSLKVTKS